MAKRSLKDHLIVFLISSILFTAGLMIGLTSSSLQSSEIESRINQFEKNLDNLEVGFLLSSTFNDKGISCNYLRTKIQEIKTEMESIGDAVVVYEEQSNIKDPNYLSLKKQYTFVRSQYWLMLERLKRECLTNDTIILYFYGTKKPCPDCRDQGVILSHLGGMDDKIYLVPVDADEELLIINTLKEAFNITMTPSLVINSNQTINGLISEDKLKKCVYNNSCA